MVFGTCLIFGYLDPWDRRISMPNKEEVSRRTPVSVLCSLKKNADQKIRLDVPSKFCEQIERGILERSDPIASPVSPLFHGEDMR